VVSEFIEHESRSRGQAALRRPAILDIARVPVRAARRGRADRKNARRPARRRRSSASRRLGLTRGSGGLYILRYRTISRGARSQPLARL